jgi:hypothetical protein
MGMGWMTRERREAGERSRGRLTRRGYGTPLWQVSAAISIGERTAGPEHLIAKDSGRVLETISDINDDGFIVGWSTVRGGRRAFLLSPRWAHARTPVDASRIRRRSA